MKKLLLIFLLCLTHSAWAEWVLVYENEEARFYVDPSSIRKEPGVLKAVDVKDMKKSELDGTKSRLALREYECEAARSRILSLSSYADQMARGEMLANSGEPTIWLDIKPGTAYYAVMLKACAK